MDIKDQFKSQFVKHSAPRLEITSEKKKKKANAHAETLRGKVDSDLLSSR